MKESLKVHHRVDVSTQLLNLSVTEDESYTVRAQGTGVPPALSGATCLCGVVLY